MAIEGLIVYEQELDYRSKRLGRISPGKIASLLINPTGEMLGIKCYGALEGGEVFSFSEPEPEWLESGVPAEALKAESMEACIWPNQPYKRWITDGEVSKLLILQCVSLAEVSEAQPAEAEQA